MTGNTLEQRAAFDSWWHKKSPELVSGDWDDDRAIAQAAWEAALRLSAGADDMALVPRHYAENVNYAAAVLEQSRSVIDRNEAPVLRKVALLIAAPRHETGE